MQENRTKLKEFSKILKVVKRTLYAESIVRDRIEE